MRFLIEFEGPIVDLAPAWFAAHEAAATAVGWSRLDQATFWRLIRTQGRTAEVLPGAKPHKLADYLARFEQQLEASESIRELHPHDEAPAALAELARRGPCHMVTLGANLPARLAVLEEQGLRNLFAQAVALSSDPRRRPDELRVLAASDPRAIVVAGTEALVRAAQSAELFTVGLTCGCCAERRLHQAGASVVLKDLAELVRSLQSGAADLIRAGLLPAPLD